MLRRRRPPSAVAFVSEDEDPKKALANRRRLSFKELWALLKILEAAVWDAVNPASDVRSQEYSEYLTSKVKGLTIGWHIFRTITEGAFLATYGIAFNTIVVQLFWIISASSLLLYSTSQSTWLRIRETICVWTNITYGIITVLKIFSLVPRLPNENNYMFKHCFLTMADAAFSQTPVHKQYVVQFAEALIRVIVWGRYNVLLDLSTPGVVAVSLAWQLWLVAFSSIMQARHVSAFRVERAAAAAAAGTSISAAATAAATVTTVTPSASAPLDGRRSGEEAAGEIVAAVTVEDSTPAEAAAGQPDPAAAVAMEPVRRRLVVSEGPRDGIGSQVQGPAEAKGSIPRTTQQQQQESCGPLNAGQSRYLHALRSVARGPSSYVLLAHQRRQVGGPQCATAQFYISSASPDMLPGNWRDKLAAGLAEGAPGWQLANVCVRKGSLIVHLDLVYCGAPQPGMEPTATGQPLPGAAAAGSGCAARAGELAAPGATWPPFVGAPAGSVEQAGKQVLDDYVGGMSAEALLELLGLPPDLPSGPAQPVAVQLGTTLLDLHTTGTGTRPPAAAAAAAVEAAADLTFRHQTQDPDMPPPTCTAPTAAAETENDAEADPTPLLATAAEAPSTTSQAFLLTAVRDVTPTTASTASFKPTSEPPANVAPTHPTIPDPSCTHPLSFLTPFTIALRPPTELSSPAYSAFLSARVGWLHVAYASCLVAACAACVVVRASTRGVNPLTLLLFLSAELLSLGGHGVMSAENWAARRAALVYVGVALRTLQMAACTCGFLPHVLKDTDCVSGRWVQKVVLITTLQALCMQPPVRSFFLVRLPSLALCIYVHVVVCQTASSILGAVVQHVGWEACLFAISAWLQHRHLEAFRATRSRHTSKDGTTTTTTTMSPTALCGGSCGGPTSRPKEQCGTEQLKAPVVDDPASPVLASPAAAPPDVSQLPSSELPKSSWDQDDGGPEAAANLIVAAALTADAPITVPLTDPTDVSVSSPVVAMTPRRAANLQLTFSCAPAVVDELQVVLRHINPAAMSSGVHTAHAVRDITHALAAPIGASTAPPHLPAPFAVDLTLVASPADMPGLVHVELWRGRRRLVSRPVLLASTSSSTAAAIPVPAAVATAPPDVDILIACAARARTTGTAADAGGCWLDDVRRYVEGLRQQGHESAADQFVEELGGWLAQAAALERGLIANARGGNTGAGAIANVLYFHGFGSDFMYLKPRRVSRGDGGDGGNGAASGPGSAGGTGGGGGQSSLEAGNDAFQGTLRQLLLCQGSMLLAVAVEAAAVSLSSYLAGLLVGQLGARLAGLLEDARTPVTQLPLIHAAVKSGSEQMVDLVAEWCTSCGVRDLWGQEAALMAVALEAAGPGGRGRINSSANSTASGIGIGQRRSSPSLVYEKLCDRSYGSGGSGGGEVLPFRFLEPQQRSGNGSLGGSTSMAHSASRNECNRSSLQPEVSGPLGNAIVDSADSLLVSAPTAPRDNLITESQPFKIVDFRVSNRSGVACAGLRACGHIASQDNNHSEGPFRNIVPAGGGSGSSVSCQSMYVMTSGGDGGMKTQHSAGSGIEAERGSLDLVGDAVLVLTPMHLALALGDGGRLAAHILRTYPEAFELWRASQGPQEAAEAAASALGPSYSEISRSSNILCQQQDEPVAAMAGGGASGAASSATSRPSSGPPENNPLKIFGAFASMPGLGSRTNLHQVLGAALGGAGQQRQDVEPRDSVEVSSLQSMSLSEVAFLEGIRWVDEAPARRAGIKVTRM